MLLISISACASTVASGDTLRIGDTYYSGRLLQANQSAWRFDFGCAGDVRDIEFSDDMSVHVDGSCQPFNPPGIGGGDSPELCALRDAISSGRIASPEFIFLATVEADDGLFGFVDKLEFRNGILKVGFLGDSATFPNESWTARIYKYGPDWSSDGSC